MISTLNRKSNRNNLKQNQSKSAKTNPTGLYAVPEWGLEIPSEQEESAQYTVRRITLDEM